MSIGEIIHAVIFVHPPHTLVVHFPIALISAGLFFILLALIMKKDLLEKIAFADLALGAVSTLVAGALGIRDNIVFYHGGAANHVMKIILASILLVITAVTAIFRWRNLGLFHSRVKWLYVVSYAISFILVTYLGFLGGVIIFGT